MTLNLTDKQNEVLDAEGHILVEGGPGSGKTTVAILKAGRIIKNGMEGERTILFLSFARATVSRVMEAIEEENKITREMKRKIEVSTYHAFFWRLIKVHGYLLGLPRWLEVLTPSREAVELSNIRNKFKPKAKLSEKERQEKKQRENKERHRLAYEEGMVCFDLFAELAGRLLHGSNKIRRLISNAYPTIILDEFQDTVPAQWSVIQALGRDSHLIALADPQQCIYEFIGADPKRLLHFEGKFAPLKFDLSGENHRSNDTDILHFGNDIVNGKFTKKCYAGVYVECFEPNENQAITKVITVALQARTRLIKKKKKIWSLAILVPTKRMTRLVSHAFNNPLANLPKIDHQAAVDMEAAILAAEIIAYLLQSYRGNSSVAQFIELVCNYFRGKGGDSPSKTNLKEATRIYAAHQKAVNCRKVGKSVPKNSIFLPLESAYEATRNLKFIGNPERDWLDVRGLLDNVNCNRLNEIAIDARDIRLLNRGTQLREALSKNWRESGCYSDALDIVRSAFVQEHFLTAKNPESGVVIMNMHKAKGKQFDEVIIFEGWPRIYRGRIVANRDRIVRGNSRSRINNQTRQNFHVSITRAKQRTTILTPKGNPCLMLVTEK